MARTLPINNRILTVIVVILLIAAGVVAYAIYHTPGPEAVTPASSSTSTTRAEDARQYIDELKASGNIDYAAAFSRAQEYQKDGRIADATLLYFYAARGGNGPAAFALAELNDPNHFQAGRSLLDHPAPYQAFKWYTVASNQGVAEAAARLKKLHDWATKAAQNGDEEARRLLLEWQR